VLLPLPVAVTHSFSTPVSTCLPGVLSCHARLEIMSSSDGEEGNSEAEAVKAEAEAEEK
jgi:hypothetical protein